MEDLYKEIGTTRQALTQLYKRQEIAMLKEDQIVKLVEEWRKTHPKMGSRPMFNTLQNIAGINLGIGVNKFEKLMIERGLVNIKPPKKWIKTSDGLGKESYTNLINGLLVTNINQVIVGDITYYHLDEKWAYIFTLKDIYSQRILGLVPALSLEAEHGVVCLKNAIKQRQKQALKGCIHHTDNGSQYNATIYKALLADVGMIISRANNCLENGSAENLNGLIKNNYLKPWKVNTFSQLQKACKELIYINNEQRAIAELGNLSPVKFEQIISQLPESERPKKYLYDFNK